MNCCIEGHKHKCKDCKYEGVDLFDEPCQGCITCSALAYAHKGACKFESKLSVIMDDLRESFSLPRESSADEIACEYFDYEGMTYGEDGEELDTPEEVEEKALKYLRDKTKA